MATTQVETVNSSADKVKLALALGLVVLSLVGFYVFAKQGAVFQWAVLLLGLLLAAVLFFMAESGRQLVAFGRSAWEEVKKVVWPAPKEAGLMTVYVFGFVLIMALFLWLTDKSLEWIFYDLILGWKK